jgi:hypothetical protein
LTFTTFYAVYAILIDKISQVKTNTKELTMPKAIIKPKGTKPDKKKGGCGSVKLNNYQVWGDE